MKALFVGAGKMATALATGIVNAGIFPPEDVLAVDISPDARKAFITATGIRCLDDATEVAPKMDLILLAVKPQVAEEVARALPKLKDNALIISICAGIPIERLSQWFSTGKIIRVMPNTPLMVGKGASCYALGPATDTDDASLADKILGSLGIARQVDEAQLDAVTALSGSGPAYFFEMIQGLVDAAVQQGLDESLALDLSVQTMAGAAEMLARKLGTPDELRIAVTSKKGTTEAGLNVLAEAEFRKILAKVVKAAKDRSVELGLGKQ